MSYRTESRSRIPRVLAILAALVVLVPSTRSEAREPSLAVTDQGGEWSDAERRRWYELDQGSRIMPLAWLKALRRVDGTLFAADGLRRYGFLPTPWNRSGLPIGFSVTGDRGSESIGMTCAACHTRRIDVDGKSYLVDGAPAMIDFQAFVSDLDEAMGRIAGDEAAFARFATDVLGTSATARDTETLRWSVAYWQLRSGTLMAASLPRDNPWGPGRLDAFTMIFNRLAGLGIGPPPGYMIPANLARADAPTRYPFLWNAAKQDVTQWAGIAPNDLGFARTMRNIGQVIGVFAEFHPRQVTGSPGAVDFVSRSSVNLPGLHELERLMERIGPPRWPWAIDRTLADRGREVYKAECNRCHAAEPGERPWRTPIEPIELLQTDARVLQLLGRKVRTGVLEGAHGLPHGPIKAEDFAVSIVTLSTLAPLAQTLTQSDLAALAERQRRINERKSGYEARVLHGVWAAAPYLHNGSVPTLADLLEPPAERSPSFAVGTAYDTKTVGLAKTQTPGSFVLRTTDCTDPSSGNSRCGHVYGTMLPKSDKRALIEYLKGL